jgi:hypothetical protein
MKNFERITELAEGLIFDQTGKSVSFIQKVILWESLNETHKTYAQIAQENNYSENYIKKLVAPKLWQLLSDTLGEKINRTNCRAVLEQRLKKTSFQTIIIKPAQTEEKIDLGLDLDLDLGLDLEVPEGQLLSVKRSPQLHR